MLPVVNQVRMAPDRNDSSKYLIFYFKNTSVYDLVFGLGEKVIQRKSDC